jgi:hypothetical protein
MIPRFVLIGFLVAHTAIHLGFLTPAPPAAAGAPPWPFDLARSWLLSPLGLDASLLRVIGIALFAAIVAGYALVPIASVVSLPIDLMGIGMIVGSAASLALLLLFFHPWLVIGVVIDLALLWAVATRWSVLGPVTT